MSILSRRDLFGDSGRKLGGYSMAPSGGTSGGSGSPGRPRRGGRLRDLALAFRRANLSFYALHDRYEGLLGDGGPDDPGWCKVVRRFEGPLDRAGARLAAAHRKLLAAMTSRGLQWVRIDGSLLVLTTEPGDQGGEFIEIQVLDDGAGKDLG